MRNNQVVLIHPPFCMPDKPYISTAVLCDYLSGQGIDVSVLDLNIEFYREYLSLSAIDCALDFINKRFHELDHRPFLNSLEIQEYRKLVHLKKRISGESPPFHLLFMNGRLSIMEQFALFGLALEIVNSLFFPESLDFTITTGYIRYSCHANKFSSQDIVGSIKKPSLYSSTLKKIISAYLENRTPNLIGISVSFPDQILPAFYTASVIREIAPEIHICFGGTFVSSHMRDIGNIELFDHIDTFILDEGEAPLLELIHCVNESRPLDHIPGLICSRDHRVLKNPPAVPCGQDRSLPLPDYGSIDLDRYLVNTDSMALLFRLSQGCYWHRCAFCRTELSFVNHHYPARFDEITAWIKGLTEKQSIRILHFTDDAADPDQLYQLSLFLIEHKLSLFWVTNMRFDPRITGEKLAAYQKAGCRAIYFGLESANERVLRKMKKGIALSFVEKTLKNCAELKIPVHLYMIVGFPTETEAEARESFEKIYAWQKDGMVSRVIYNVFEISGGSDIALHPENYGITGIRSAPSRDLNPPISDFICSGMERKKTESLCAEFIAALSHIRPTSKKEMMDLFLSADPGPGQDDIETGYDMDAIQAEIKRLFAENDAKAVRFGIVPGFTLSRQRNRS